ncbi:hypothetical protein I4U23_027484 [Adineta vaga]|nr:hypothetical protein I4U23_027484 [Adineta vaga]
MKRPSKPRLSFVEKPKRARRVTISNTVRISRVNQCDANDVQISQRHQNMDTSTSTLSSSNQRNRARIQLDNMQLLYRDTHASSIFKQNRISPNNIHTNLSNISLDNKDQWRKCKKQEKHVETRINQEPNDMHRRLTDNSKQSFDSFTNIFRYRESDDERSEKRRRRRGIFFKTPECCCLCIGATVTGFILLGALIAAIALIAKDSTSSTTTSTTVSTTSTTTTISTPTTSTSVTTVTASDTTTTETSTIISTSSTSTTVSTSTASLIVSTETTSETTTVTDVTTISTTETSTNIITTTTTSESTTPTTSFDTCNGIKWNKTGIRVAGDGSTGGSSNQLNKPRCVYVDANDTVYVCDTENHRIQKWPKGASVGTTLSSGLNKPLGLTFDTSGNMYVADTENCRVAKFIPPSTSGTTVAGTSGSCGNSNNQLDKPSGVAVDSSGKLYVTDTNSNRVMKYNSGSTTGTSVLTSINSPYGIMFRNDSSNQVYISQISTKLLQLWTLGASSPDVTLGTSSNFNEPKQIAIDWYGNVYVTDEQNDRIQMFCAGSSTVKTVANGGSGYTPTLDEQTGIAFDSNMNLYVTSITPSGVYKYMRI